MLTLRKLVPALCLTASLSGLAAYAAETPAGDTAATGAASSPGAHGWHGRHHHGFMGMMLHKLALTDTQKTQVKSILAGEKSQFQALRASVQANRQALETTPPTDPQYASLLQTAQTNAQTRVKLMSDTWSAVYENVLTKKQQAEIPGIVAAMQAQRAQRMAAWKAQHAQGAPSAD
ncbi:MAG TPA: Spy/CpxP family protein refolding chaperone [Steroidobacteraceae bacterium]|nr:Spy/CpxP family protein refolding chaperone [Steroidobacteraceae bacterium]